MSKLMHSISSIPATPRDRKADHCPTQKVELNKMVEMIEQCRLDQGEVAQGEVDQIVESAIPTPVVEEQITRPYPPHVYATMMAANETATRSHPESSSQELPARRVTLPGMRSTHSNLMEMVVLVAGAIALPAITLATFQSFAEAPPASDAAVVGNPSNAPSAKPLSTRSSSSSVAPRLTPAMAGEAGSGKAAKPSSAMED